MSPSDTSLVEEEGADVDGADWDGVEQEGGAAESNYRDLNPTPNPNYEWDREGQCRWSSLKWLSVPNEHLVEKSSPRSPFKHPHHGTE